MALAPDVGVIPPKFRNRGYDKLGFGPGEGGLGDMRKANERRRRFAHRGVPRGRGRWREPAGARLGTS